MLDSGTTAPGSTTNMDDIYTPAYDYLVAKLDITQLIQCAPAAHTHVAWGKSICALIAFKWCPVSCAHWCPVQLFVAKPTCLLSGCVPRPSL